MWQSVWLFVVGGICVDILAMDNVVSKVNAEETSGSIRAGSTRRNIKLGYGDIKTEDPRNVVTTDHGRVRGYEEDGILQFFDIPYGSFPSGSPFQAPSEPESWSNVRELTSHKTRCPQINEDKAFVGTCDCLTLSVFKSNIDDSGKFISENVRRDVLLHIHDGSFSSGSADPLTYGPKNLASRGLILVLPNYRLGPLGFLCLRNDTAPGNAALKDLTLALEWTVRNIGAFGGNASNIVVSGSGTGGVLVEFLLLSKSSKKYISKAITESGFSLSPWAFDRYPLMTARSLLQNLSNADNLLDTFDAVDIEAVVRAASDINFKPCIENEIGFITETPWDILQDHTLKIPYMTGSANHAAMKKALQLTEEIVTQLNNNLSMLLPSDLKFDSTEDKTRIGLEVRNQYFGERNITLADKTQLSLCYTDSEYLYSGLRVARLLLKAGVNIFFYEFSFNREHPQRGIDGAALGDSFHLIFSKDEENSETKNKTRMRDIMTKLWISFIKTGTPALESLIWTEMGKVAPAEEAWLSIGTEVDIRRGVHLQRLNLWQDIYEQYFVEINPGSMQKPSLYILLLSVLFLCKSEM